MNRSGQIDYMVDGGHIVQYATPLEFTVVDPLLGKDQRGGLVQPTTNAAPHDSFLRRFVRGELRREGKLRGGSYQRRRVPLIDCQLGAQGGQPAA